MAFPSATVTHLLWMEEHPWQPYPGCAHTEFHCWGEERNKRHWLILNVSRWVDRMGTSSLGGRLGLGSLSIGGATWDLGARPLGFAETCMSIPSVRALLPMQKTPKLRVCLGITPCSFPYAGRGGLAPLPLPKGLFEMFVRHPCKHLLPQKHFPPLFAL